MTGRSKASIERALLRKGFVRLDAHHRFLVLLGPTGEELLRTRLSHGIAEYGDDLLSKVAHQLHLSKREPLELIDCRMSGEEYTALLRERGVLG